MPRTTRPSMEEALAGRTAGPFPGSANPEEGVLAPSSNPSTSISFIHTRQHRRGSQAKRENPQHLPADIDPRGGEIERLGQIIERLVGRMETLERRIIDMTPAAASPAPETWIPATSRRAQRTLRKCAETIQDACKKAYAEHRAYGDGYDFVVFGNVRGYCEKGPHTGNKRYGFKLRAEDL